jgi:LGFP repeat
VCTHAHNRDYSCSRTTHEFPKTEKKDLVGDCFIWIRGGKGRRDRQTFKTLLKNGRNLGAPITDESTTPDGVGRFSHFEFRPIYWTATTLAVGIWGPFRDRWAALGWERGRLGYPTLEPTQSPGQPGWYARFQNGILFHVQMLPLHLKSEEASLPSMAGWDGSGAFSGTRSPGSRTRAVGAPTGGSINSSMGSSIGVRARMLALMGETDIATTVGHDPICN